MRTFTMFRRNVPDETHNADQKNGPDEPQFQGVEFDDGTVVIRWMTGKRSTAVWASMEDMLAIHGHPEYGSELVWGEYFGTTRESVIPARAFIGDTDPPTGIFADEPMDWGSAADEAEVAAAALDRAAWNRIKRCP